jgi:hypothetical protein
MEEMNGYEWFCANCMRMVDVLSRHGRCPTVTAMPWMWRISIPALEDKIVQKARRSAQRHL